MMSGAQLLTISAIALVVMTICAESYAMKKDLPAIDSGWNFQDPQQSEANFRDFVQQGEALGDGDYAAEAMTQLARSLGLQQRFEEAHETLDRVEKLVFEESSVVHVRIALERGRVINSSGKPAESVPHFETALALATSTGEEYLAVDAAHMLGIVATPSAAIEWNERAIFMAETASDPRARRWLGPLYNNLAWTYNDLGEHHKALALFDKDIIFRNSQGARFEASIARWSRAKTLRLLGRPAEALAELQALVDHPDRQGNPAEGYTHEEIGECLLLLGRADAATPHFAIAFARLSEDAWLRREESARLARLEGLANGN